MFKVFLTISTKDYFRTIIFFFNGEGRDSFPIRERAFAAVSSWAAAFC